MTKKFKELAAFETNEFKVGDLINVYDKEKVIEKLVVTNIDGDFIENFLTAKYNPLSENQKMSIDIMRFNFKQCRKLVEVEPREFWLSESTQKFYTWDEVGSMRLVKENFIKVREVLE